MSFYLSVCAIYRDEAPYLREWIEFHRLVGVERFFLYDNGSVDDHEQQLSPYLRDGTVTLHEWPLRPGQLQAYERCLREHGAESRWIAFIDLDEFLFSPTSRLLTEVLRDYEEWAAVCVNWAVFGASGHKTKPEGLVTENFVWRCETDHRGNQMVKTIVDPRQVQEPVDPHHFRYKGNAFAIDETGTKVRAAVNDTVTFSRLRVNHYFTKSEEEFRRKLAKGKADKPETREAALVQLPKIVEAHHKVRDETIQSFLPALETALATGDAGAEE